MSLPIFFAYQVNTDLTSPPVLPIHYTSHYQQGKSETLIWILSEQWLSRPTTGAKVEVAVEVEEEGQVVVQAEVVEEVEATTTTVKEEEEVVKNTRIMAMEESLLNKIILYFKRSEIVIKLIEVARFSEILLSLQGLHLSYLTTNQTHFCK